MSVHLGLLSWVLIWFMPASWLLILPWRLTLASRREQETFACSDAEYHSAMAYLSVSVVLSSVFTAAVLLVPATPGLAMVAKMAVLAFAIIGLWHEVRELQWSIQDYQKFQKRPKASPFS